MLSPPITLLVPNPRAQPNYSCVGFDSIAKVIGELAQVDDDHSAHFCSSYANLESTAGLKKAGVPARLLSNHRNAGLRQEKSADRDDHEWWFLVLCGSRFPQTTYRVLADSGKSPRRYIDRKVSTKSVF